jgi:hypothetical protein
MMRTLAEVDRPRRAKAGMSMKMPQVPIKETPPTNFGPSVWIRPAPGIWLHR